MWNLSLCREKACGPERGEELVDLVADCLDLGLRRRGANRLIQIRHGRGLAHASRQQDKVAEYLGKAGTEGEASSSAIPSATRSRGSRKRSDS